MKQDLRAYLKARTYPGRGILLGRSPDGTAAIAAYFIMGRSANSRNRVFAATEDGIRTKAFDESKVEDPSLIMYHPVRRMPDGTLIVTNGDQTDSVRDGFTVGWSFEDALRARSFEPDGPNWTPRISGLLNPDGSYALSLIKALDGDPACCCHYYFAYDNPPAGAGQFLSTYQDDGTPLPSFAGEPILVSIPQTTPGELAEDLWQSLNKENRVSLYVEWRVVDGGSFDTVIINANEQEGSDAGD